MVDEQRRRRGRDDRRIRQLGVELAVDLLAGQLGRDHPVGGVAQLVGGHIVGTRATDLIQELVNAKTLEGGFPEVARIVHGHPTLSEAVMEAARAADGWLIHG